MYRVLRAVPGTHSPKPGLPSFFAGDPGKGAGVWGRRCVAWALRGLSMSDKEVGDTSRTGTLVGPRRAGATGHDAW